MKFGGYMNYKKYLLIFLSTFILIACKKLPENNTRSNYEKVKLIEKYNNEENILHMQKSLMMIRL